jgi:DNA-binding NarL/FixJ family response regulator
MTLPIRVLVAEDHPILRKSLSRFIDSQEDFTIVGKAADGVAAVRAALTLKPDVVLMDYSMPRMNGVEATRQISQSNPEIVVIGFSMHEEGPAEQAMLAAGAVSHISKSQSTKELLAVIREFCQSAKLASDALPNDLA